MATIAQDRMRHLQLNSMGGVQPTADFPITSAAGSGSVVPGSLWKTASGLAAIAAAGDVKLIGFNDKKTPTGTPTANTPLNLILFLPNVFYEMSFETGAAAVTRLGVAVQHVVNATFGATIGTSATTPALIPFGFFGTALGSMFTYTVNPFIGQSDTTATAGQTMAGGITDKGTIGDTTPRLIVMANVTACGLIIA